MKKCFFVAFCVLSFTNVFGQDTLKTLIKFSKPQYVGLYLAPEYQYGQFGGSFTSMRGVSAMFVLNKKWAFGLASQASADNNYAPSDVSPLYLKGGFVGLRTEYTLKPNAAVHFTFPLTVGVGIARTSAATFDTRFSDNNSTLNSFALIQTGVHAEANLIRYVKVFGGASYRFAVNNSVTTVPTNTMQGLSLDLGLKLGIFDMSLKRHKKEKAS